MKNWKTTAAGILYGIGKYLQTVTNGPLWLYPLAQVIEGIAIAGGFMVANDTKPPIK